MLNNITFSKSLSIRLINFIAFGLIGIYCLASAIFGSAFAELKLELPFLNFPIFIGEILLFICFVLVGLKHKINKIEIKLPLLVKTLVVFVLFKAVWGYLWWQGLALRNAALFYYPLFAILAYCFYDQKILTHKTDTFPLILFLSITLPLYKEPTVFLYEVYFLFTAYIILAILFLKTEFIPLKVSGMILTAFLFFNSDLANEGKGILLALVGALFYCLLALTIYLCKKLKRSRLVIYVLLAIFIALVAVFNLVLSQKMRQRLKYCADFSKYAATFQEIDRHIQRRRVLYKPKRYQVKVFEDKKAVAASHLEKGSSEILEDFVSIFGSEAEVDFLLRKEIAGVKLDNDQIIAAKHLMFKVIPLELAQELKRAADENISQESYLVLRQNFVANMNKRIDKNISDNAIQVLGYLASEANKYQWQQNLKVVIDYFYHDKIHQDIDRLIVEKLGAEPRIVERVPEGDFYSIMWRLFVWRDMLKETFVQGSFWQFACGSDFGKPFRSQSIEIMDWSSGYWVGWLEPHNSFIHVLYRAGLIGVLFIGYFLFIFVKVAVKFVQEQKIIGILASGILIFWVIIANFEVILELPYFAIPFWSFFGWVFAYAYKLDALVLKEKAD